MNNELDKILQNAKISVKWYNMGTWQKESYNNLLELISEEKLDINNSKEIEGGLVIDWNYGNQEHMTITNFADIERDLYIMLAQKCLYRGDKCIIKTRLRNWNI